MVGAIHFLILPLVSLARPEQSPVHLCLGPAKSTQADVDFFLQPFYRRQKSLLWEERMDFGRGQVEQESPGHGFHMAPSTSNR